MLNLFAPITNKGGTIKTAYNFEVVRCFYNCIFNRLTHKGRK